MSDYKPLTQEQARQLARAEYNRQAKASVAHENPVVYFVAGQSGAGKSQASDVLKGELHNDVIHIDVDRVRLLIPDARNFPADTTQKDCQKIVAHLQRLAIAGQRNIIEEGIFKTHGVFSERAEKMRGQGYRAEVIGIATHRESSRFAVLFRREKLRDEGKPPRDVPEAVQDAAYEGYRYNMLCDIAELSRVRVVNRDGHLLYDSVGAGRCHSVAEAMEKGGNLSDQQIVALADDWQALQKMCEDKRLADTEMARVHESRARFEAFAGTEKHLRAQAGFAPRHDINKNQAEMHVAATERIAANLDAMKQNPALAKHPPEALEKLAYWRGIVQETVKQEPSSAQDVALAKFDKAAENPALLARL
ncbi:MAG: zeta toxin family protein, partial [Candidatus Accumulibacter sp.]|nr:zeta toxin family protein [Accumulibacter sp.]